MEKKPLIIIAGPTAIGKSEIAIQLAKLINGKIISADSMQVYKGMDIGTAKVTKEEMENIPHYLIDVHEPDFEYNIVNFQKEARAALDIIYNMDSIPIIVGGTGFYIQSIIYEIDFSKGDEQKDIREELQKIADEKGNEYLHGILKECDPKSARILHPNDVKRVIRAIEYYRQTSESIADHNEECKNNESPYNFCYFCLNDDREKIYERIDLRVDKMIENGLVNEVAGLLKKGLTIDNISMKGLGYKEIIRYLNGEISLDEAVRIIKRDTRHFAKRQITWFKREKDVIFVERSSQDIMLETMMNELRQKKII